MSVVSKVVLFSMPRTGSTMVTRQLARHPEIRFVGSIFAESGWHGVGRHYRELHEGLTDEWEELAYRVTNHKALLEKWFGAAGPGQCAGLKQHLSGAAEVTETLAADPEIGAILLTRSNFLACYSSDKIVRLTQAGSASGARKAVFDADEFEQFVIRRQETYDHWRSKIAGHSRPYLEIDYVEARRHSGIERIVSFLGLDPAQCQSSYTRKRNSDDIVSRFRNPDAVLRYLDDNGLQNWKAEQGTDDPGDPPASETPAVDTAVLQSLTARRTQRLQEQRQKRIQERAARRREGRKAQRKAKRRQWRSAILGTLRKE